MDEIEKRELTEFNCNNSIIENERIVFIILSRFIENMKVAKNTYRFYVPNGATECIGSKVAILNILYNDFRFIGEYRIAEIISIDDMSITLKYSDDLTKFIRRIE
jgi:hypothetical protein